MLFLTAISSATLRRSFRVKPWIKYLFDLWLNQRNWFSLSSSSEQAAYFTTDISFYHTYTKIGVLPLQRIVIERGQILQENFNL